MMVFKKIILFFLILVSSYLSCLFSMERSGFKSDKLAKKYVNALNEEELKTGCLVPFWSDEFKYHLLNKYFLLKNGKLLYDFNISKNSENQFLLNSFIKVLMAVNKNFEQGRNRLSFLEFSLAKDDSLLTMSFSQKEIGLLLRDLFAVTFFDEFQDECSLEYSYGQNFDSVRIDFDSRKMILKDSNAKTESMMTTCIFGIGGEFEGYKIFGFVKLKAVHLNRHELVKQDKNSEDDSDEVGCCCDLFSRFWKRSKQE